ncbi:hypothetical protein SAMN04488568_104203 [Maricaulis salignorans]|uniref:Uncharacterized protein n=2 Tax=Maricaulis salignorans TaxID=144026 RepID=A0A1G9Q8N6_9PROT|nr:hypothetical protein SAMN04488568_104203 [Maricaulis salignorans]
MVYLAQHHLPVDTCRRVAHSQVQPLDKRVNMNTRLLLLTVAITLPAPALAQAPSAPLDDLFACEAITEDLGRLACLDAAVAALHSDTESGSIIALNRGDVEAAEEATFGLRIPGLSLPSLPRLGLPRGSASDLAAADASTTSSSDRAVSRDANGQIDRIDNLAVASIGFNRSRRAVVTLVNGQIWQQLDSDSTHVARSTDISEGASIRSAALDSYMMRVGDNGRWFRARRTQ